MAGMELSSVAGGDRIASASGAGGSGGSGFYNLGDVVAVNGSEVFATDFAPAEEAMNKSGVVAYMPVKDTDTCELALLHCNLDAMAVMMTRLMEGKPKGNRGVDRHCLNDFSASLFDGASYELIRQRLLPGRITLQLLQKLYLGCSYDTGIGDYVKAKQCGHAVASRLEHATPLCQRVGFDRDHHRR